MSEAAERETSNGRRRVWMTRGLLTVAVAMFGFGFVIAPLYSLLCKAAGIQVPERSAAAAARVSLAPAASAAVRSVTVRFDANVASGLPWEFKAQVRKLDVTVDRTTEVRFAIRNLGSSAVIGRAVPAVTPWQATQYFVKTECFCFREQTLKPGETLELPVRFRVSPDLPHEINSLTLSYTFMRRDAPQSGARSPASDGAPVAPAVDAAAQPPSADTSRPPWGSERDAGRAGAPGVVHTANAMYPADRRLGEPRSTTRCAREDHFSAAC